MVGAGVAEVHVRMATELHRMIADHRIELRLHQRHIDRLHRAVIVDHRVRCFLAARRYGRHWRHGRHGFETGGHLVGGTHRAVVVIVVVVRGTVVADDGRSERRRVVGWTSGKGKIYFIECTIVNNNEFDLPPSSISCSNESMCATPKSLAN